MWKLPRSGVASKYGKRQLRRDPEVHNSIIITWQITFEHLRRAQSAAVGLLSLMSMFDPGTIQQRFLRVHFARLGARTSDRPVIVATIDIDDNTNSTFKLSAASIEQFAEDVRALREHYLITENESGENFISVLIYEAARQGQTARNIQLQVTQYFEAKRPRDPQEILENRDSLAMCHINLDEWNEAEGLLTQQAAAYYELHRSKSWHFYVSLNNLAAVVHLQGRSAEAQQLLNQVYAGFGRMFGPSDNQTSQIREGLAATYWRQDKTRFADAMNTLLELRQTYLSSPYSEPNHCRTLKIIADLASVWLPDGRFKEEEDLRTCVYQRTRETYGPNHLDTLAAMSNLARSLKRNFRHTEAVELLEDCLRRRKEVMGSDHE
ncbi:hypothetical protein E8E11_004115 [Didymella keratinophila]|nr:hypothetical protein E8E11_004115 [Didymella keratinophila]